MSTPPFLDAQRIARWCEQHLATCFDQTDLDALCRFLTALGETRQCPPVRGRQQFDWFEIARSTDIPRERLRAHVMTLRPLLDALRRHSTAGYARPPSSVPRPRATPPRAPHPPRLRPGPRPREIIKVAIADPQRPSPSPLDDFATALRIEVARHRETFWSLHRALTDQGVQVERSTLRQWGRGRCEPQSVTSLAAVAAIEARYGRPSGFLRDRLAHRARASKGLRIRAKVTRSERRRLAWHLPDDFDQRTLAEQNEILNWVRTRIISGATDYRRYQSEASKHRFGLRFNVDGLARPVRASADLAAPAGLNRELKELLRFKTSVLTPLGYSRNGIWGAETASQKIEHLSLLFGAICAARDSEVKGLGVEREKLTLGLLAFPRVWDWYLRWRHERRGFYTSWEVDMLMVGLSLVRVETGWIRQTPMLVESLTPIDGLIDGDDISRARDDWGAACDRMFDYGRAAAREVQKVTRVHRDPFEPILPVLEAERPLAEYRKIADEIARYLPLTARDPKATAEAVRALLIFRLALHLGLRQRNLRQLLFCSRTGVPRTERQLTDLRRGELRWSERDQGWEVFIPSVAFKNAESSFFGKKPFRLLLPDIGELYRHIDSYLVSHRRQLVGAMDDPGTFFVKTATSRSQTAEYDQSTFYEAWRCIIQRYGIYNPYTGRGAVPGLLPHGPHNVRDVLATHILKVTGSYQQASYAIQDTPEMVAQHYGRFLPEDKSAMAATILNQVWLTA